MPMIRYRIGDQGRLTERLCDCGRKLPLLESISGRIVEVLENPKGEQVDPFYFIYLLGITFNNGNLPKFQVVQDEDLSLDREILPGGRHCAKRFRQTSLRRTQKTLLRARITSSEQ
jgi:phenylacetate-CoA ligase